MCGPEEGRSGVRSLGEWRLLLVIPLRSRRSADLALFDCSSYRTSRPSSSAAPQRPTASETRRASIATAPLAPPPSYFPPGARDLSTTFDRTLSFQHPQTSATPTSVSPPSPSVFAQQQQQQQQQWAPTPFTPSSFLKQDTHMSGGAEQMQLPGLEVMFGERRAGMRLY